MISNPSPFSVLKRSEPQPVGELAAYYGLVDGPLTFFGSARRGLPGVATGLAWAALELAEATYPGRRVRSVVELNGVVIQTVGDVLS